MGLSVLYSGAVTSQLQVVFPATSSGAARAQFLFKIGGIAFDDARQLGLATLRRDPAILPGSEIVVLKTHVLRYSISRLLLPSDEPVLTGDIITVYPYYSFVQLVVWEYF